MSSTRKTTSNNYRQIEYITQNGFSLLELAIVLSMMAVLLSIAVPSYQKYIIETKRLAAKILLLRYATALDRYYFIHHTYQGVTADTLKLPQTSDQYRISLSKLSDNNYTINAIPQGVQAKRDTCGTLSIDAEDERLPKSCWNFEKRLRL